MSEGKTYIFRWSAHGSITVRGYSPEEAEGNALDALHNLVTMDAGNVSVEQVNING